MILTDIYVELINKNKWLIIIIIIIWLTTGCQELLNT